MNADSTPAQVNDVLDLHSHSVDLLARYADKYADPHRPLDDLVQIDDPAFYVRPWEIYARLRSEAPVYYCSTVDTWVASRWEDVRYVSKTPELFSSAQGILLLDRKKEAAGLVHAFADGREFIGLSDPPRHSELRRVMSRPFTPTAIGALTEKIGTYIDELLCPIEPGVSIDWVEQVASKLPLMVLCAIIGLPKPDNDFFRRARRWADANENLASRDLSDHELDAVHADFADLMGYVREVMRHKQEHRGDDFLSYLLSEDLFGKQISEINVVGFCQTLIVAGVDTTRSHLSEIMAHLALHQSEQAALFRDPALIPNAIEEALRYMPAAHGFSRTVTASTRLHDVELKAGDRIYMAYDSANRDPDVFSDAERFDISRAENRKHLSFGFGAHACVAAPLVRSVTHIMLRQVMEKFGGFDLAGGSQRVETFLRNGWTRLPLEFR